MKINILILFLLPSNLICWAPFPTSPNQTLYGTSNTAQLGNKSISLGDLNGDGYGDIAISNSSYNGSIEIYSGSPNGFNVSPTAVIAGDVYKFVNYYFDRGDFDGDGKTDLAIYESGPGGPGSLGNVVSIYRGLGNFNFSYVNSLTVTSVSGIQSADLNGDGKSDLVVEVSGMAVVYYGKNFPLNTAWDFQYNFTSPAVIGPDINKDGFPDAIATCTGGCSSGSIGLITFLGSPAGLSVSYTPYLTSYLYSISSGDFNGDGFADVIYRSFSTNQIKVLYGSATGALQNGTWTDTPQSNGWGIGLKCIGDVNSDGIEDVAVGGADYGVGSGKVSVYLGNENGFSKPAWSYFGTTIWEAVGGDIFNLGDINGDKINDIGVTGNNKLMIFFGNGSEIFNSGFLDPKTVVKTSTTGRNLCFYYPKKLKSSIWTILNSAGEVVAKSSFENQAPQCIDTSKFAAGFYFMSGEITYESGEMKKTILKTVIK